MGMQIIAATMENAVEVPQKKLNMELPYDPAIPLLGVYSKAMESQPQRDIRTPSSFIHDSRGMEATWVSIHRRMYKEAML